MSPCARWPLLFFISPACIFHSISPPTWSFRRLGSRICHRVPAGPCRCSPRRRAFFIAIPRRRARLAAWGVEYVSACPLVAAVLHLAGVHFHSESPPACSSRRWRRRICLRVPAGRCRCSPHRRAFFIAIPRGHGRFDCAGGEYVSVCPPAAAVAHLTGVQKRGCREIDSSTQRQV